MITRILATATSLAATGLLAGCYVIPIDPRYPAAEQTPLVVAGNLPAAAPPAVSPTLQARLYPLNDIAGGMGALSVTLSDDATGRASFSLTYAGELLQGEATRVGPHYPGFGRVHRISNGAKFQVHFGS